MIGILEETPPVTVTGEIQMHVPLLSNLATNGRPSSKSSLYSGSRWLEDAEHPIPRSISPEYAPETYVKPLCEIISLTPSYPLDEPNEKAESNARVWFAGMVIEVPLFPPLPLERICHG